MCSLKDLNKRRLMPKTAPRCDKKFVSYGKLKRESLSALPGNLPSHAFSQKSKPSVNFFSAFVGKLIF